MVFVGIDFLPIRHIDAHHALAVDGGSQNAFLLVFVVGNADLHLAGRAAAENRHAVVGFLPGKHAVVTGCLQSLLREVMVLQFGFLQAQHLDRVVAQPVQHLRQTHLERIDVPGGQLHA